jgi:hypothetical protein
MYSVDLAAGQLAAFAGLRALRHFDLQLVGVGVRYSDRDAETSRRDLLDGRALRSRRPAGPKRFGSSPPSPVFDLPPMRFIAMASASCASFEIEPRAHRARAKRLTISFADSHFVEGDARRALEADQAAQRAAHALVLVHVLREGPVRALVVAASRLLISSIERGSHMCFSPSERQCT